MKRADITALFPDATDEQIKSLMALNGDDINAAKKNNVELKEQLTAAQARITELEALTTEEETMRSMENLRAELDGLKAANAIRDMRARIAGEKKVPVELLTGETEEACSQQADQIITYAEQFWQYPIVWDGGEAYAPEAPKTARERFVEYFENSSFNTFNPNRGPGGWTKID